MECFPATKGFTNSWKESMFFKKTNAQKGDANDPVVHDYWDYQKAYHAAKTSQLL